MQKKFILGQAHKNKYFLVAETLVGKKSEPLRKKRKKFTSKKKRKKKKYKPLLGLGGRSNK